MATNVIGLRSDTHSNWNSNNPTLLDGEHAIVTDKRKIIEGDGSAYNTSYDTMGRLSGWSNITAVSSSTYTVLTADDVIELDDGSSAITVTLPDRASNQGRYFTVRLVDGTNGATINRAGSDTITRASLTSVTLTSDGDFWTFLAGSTRWELVDGVESGSNSNGYYYLYADGTQECYRTLSTTEVENTSTAYNTTFYYYPVPFETEPHLISRPSDGGTLVAFPASSETLTDFYATCSNNEKWNCRLRISISNIVPININATGRWYE